MPIVWARILGFGPYSPDDFGHHVATNAAGEALVSAQLERAPGDGAYASGPPAEPARDGDDTRDLSTAQMVKLAPDGRRLWALPLRAARLLRPPSVALDDHGCAYVVGPYMPDGHGLRFAREVALTKLGPSGEIGWSRVLGALQEHDGSLRMPVPRVAAAPPGGACVTWVGRGRRSFPALRAAQVSEDNSVEWDHAWPVAGEVHAPHVAIDATGAAVVWGELRGALFFSPTVRVETSGHARYLARIRPDGEVGWAQSFAIEHGRPSALAVARDGVIGVVTTAQSKGTELHLIRVDPAGAPLTRTRGRCDPHTSVTALCVTPVGGGGFVVAGYLSGGLRFGGATIQSLTQAQEAVFIACATGAGEWTARVFQGPQLQGGLSVHGSGDGSVLTGGWLCGSMLFGEHKLVTPRDRMGLFLVKIATR